MLRIATLTAIIVIAGTLSSHAHSNGVRQADQAAAIEAGRQDGSITWREGRALRKEQAAIAQARETLESDGHLSSADRRILHKLQNEADANIALETSDRAHRAWWLPRVGR